MLYKIIEGLVARRFSEKSIEEVKAEIAERHESMGRRIAQRLEIEGVESGPFPVKAHGFLQFSPKDYPNGELMLEVRGKEIWIWVAERRCEKNGEIDHKST